jgi:hypothetical protein
MDPQFIALQQQLANQQALLQQQNADLQALLQAQQPAVGPFALTPAQARQDVIDLSSPSGIKLHTRITTAMTTPFDGAPNKLSAFLTAVSERANACNWTQTLLQISDQGAPPRDLNLITQHRMLSLENVRAHAATHVGQQTRRAQDASWMYEFLRDSLTEAARTRVALRSEQFTVQGVTDGPCYLKTILMTFYVETNATNFFLREQLHDLPAKIVQLEFDIADFNEYVRETLVDLASGGGDITDDLLVYLFKAYHLVEDHAFQSWIIRKKEDHDDGRETPTPDTLMAQAETKFQQLKQGDKWQAKSPAETQIIALTAQLKATEQKLSALTKKGTSTGTKKAADTKATSSNSASDRKGNRNYPAWRYERDGDKSKLDRDGKTYWWCEVLNLWAAHKPSECKAKASQKPKPASQGDAAPDSLSLAHALVAVTSPNHDDDDDSQASS